MLLFGDKELPVSAGGFYLLGCLPIGDDAFFPSKIRDVNLAPTNDSSLNFRARQLPTSGTQPRHLRAGLSLSPPKEF
jgi:hypothetical protein